MSDARGLPPSATARAALAVAIGAGTTVAVGVPLGFSLGALLGIGAAAAVFAAVGWFVLWPLDDAATRATVRRENFRPRVAELVVGVIAVSGLAAIVILLAFTQLVEPIARIALATFDVTSSVSKFLPGSAADALVGSSFFATMGGGSDDLLPQWAGALVMLAYIAAFAVIGRYTTFRRDIA